MPFRQRLEQFGKVLRSLKTEEKDGNTIPPGHSCSFLEEAT